MDLTLGKALIALENVSLSIPSLRAASRPSLTHPMRLVASLYVNRRSRFSATLLNDINFALMPGERVGVLGRNGAGKTSLLRLIGRVYEPTSGTITFQSSPMGFFSTQSGILADATGLENIYLRGIELGLNLSEIRQRLDSIVEFSGLGAHLDKPVYTYSAGMKLRLAVAITFTVEPDVLLLDEWIGAGDSTFRERISGRLNEIIDNSRGLMLASHNHGLLERVCNRAIVMSNGTIVHEGLVGDCIEYFKLNQRTL